MASSFSNVGVLNPLVQAPALERVVHLARAIGCEDDQRRFEGPHGPELGNGDLVFGEQLEQKPFELLVGAIDFVDEQDRGTRAERIDRLKQRSLDEKGLAVEVAPRGFPIERVGGVENAQFEELPRRSPTRTAHDRRRGLHNIGDE